MSCALIHVNVGHDGNVRPTRYVNRNQIGKISMHLIQVECRGILVFFHGKHERTKISRKNVKNRCSMNSLGFSQLLQRVFQTVNRMQMRVSTL